MGCDKAAGTAGVGRRPPFSGSLNGGFVPLVYYLRSARPRSWHIRLSCRSPGFSAQAMQWVRLGAAAQDRHVVLAAVDLAEFVGNTVVVDADWPKFARFVREVFGPGRLCIGFVHRGRPDQIGRVLEGARAALRGRGSRAGECAGSDRPLRARARSEQAQRVWRLVSGLARFNETLCISCRTAHRWQDDRAPRAIRRKRIPGRSAALVGAG